MTTAAEAEAQAGARLHRVLGVWDLALFTVAAVASLRILSIAAQVGPSSLTLWVLGLLTFFIPLALAVLELSSRVPGEGGLYLWARAAFGDLGGFIAGWAYTMSNLVYFPSLLIAGAVSLAFAVAGTGPLVDDPWFNGAFCVIALWLTTWINIIGLERAKWLADMSGIFTWAVAAALIAAGVYAWFTAPAATPITATNIIPDFAHWATFVSFSSIALAYVGIELGPIMGGEIKDPQRTIRRAILLAGVIIAAIYLLGTLALLVALPTKAIDTINGVPQALAAVGDSVGIPMFGTIAAVLISAAAVGGLSAWLGGTGRLPFVFGLDRYFPAALGRLHPKYGTPHVALLVQSALATVVLTMAVAGSTVQEAFQLLLDMTIVLSLAPILFIFASLPVLRWRACGKNDGVHLAPGGLFGCIVISMVGFAVTLLAIVVSLIPPDDADPALFFAKVGGGSALIVAVGLAFFFSGRARFSAAGSR